MQFQYVPYSLCFYVSVQLHCVPYSLCFRISEQFQYVPYSSYFNSTLPCKSKNILQVEYSWEFIAE